MFGVNLLNVRLGQVFSSMLFDLPQPANSFILPAWKSFKFVLSFKLTLLVEVSFILFLFEVPVPISDLFLHFILNFLLTPPLKRELFARI